MYYIIQCKIINLRKAIQIENICIAFYINDHGKDIGIDYEVVYLDESTMPKDAKGSTGSAYILDEKNRKVLIPIDVNKVKDIDDEKGSESLGRPANDYVKNKLGDDNNSDVSIHRQI